MNKLSKLSVLIFFIFLNIISTVEAKMSANEILIKSENVYESCKSYVDTGYVKTEFLKKDGTKTNVTKKKFSTAYIRPNRFRFECAEMQAGELQRPYIVWKNNQLVKTYWELMGEDTPESLSMAIAGATGVSGGSALNISSLLITEICRKTLLTRINNPHLVAEKQDENGAICFVIPIKRNNESIWIQKETLLISKIEEYTEFDDFNTKSITVYKPQINIEIPENKLKFKQ